MWKIDKPELSRAMGKDLRELVANCDELDDTDKPAIKQLYKEYDDQHGSVTDAQLNAISTEKAKAIHVMYKETYENKSLAYIRDELMEVVYKCPYCGTEFEEIIDEVSDEVIICPECGNQIELDWDGNPNDDDKGCSGNCGNCGECK